MKPPSAYSAVQSNVLSLIQDGARLLDLQMQLLTVDVREFWSRAKWGIGVLVVAGVLILATLPVLLLGIAYAIHTTWELSLAMSMAISGGAGLVLGIIALIWSVRKLTRAGERFQRSQIELSENLSWFRSMLHGDHHSP